MSVEPETPLAACQEGAPHGESGGAGRQGLGATEIAKAFSIGHASVNRISDAGQ